MKTILITGGCGFIASNFIQRLLSRENDDYYIINIDKLNYCGNTKNVEVVYDFHKKISTKQKNLHRYKHYICDINDCDTIMKILITHKISIIYHFAAQTHVDNSFGNSLHFVTDNIHGTATLLECVRNYINLGYVFEKFIHVSTDEVYGNVSTEIEKHVLKHGLLEPTNPYAATKAGAEMLVKAFGKSYNIPFIITRSNNVIGEHQYGEKIVPKFLKLLYDGKKCTIHGNGEQLRKYLDVDDACDAYELILEKGKIGSIYEMDSQYELSVLDITKKIIYEYCKNTNKNMDIIYDNYIDYINDRPFQDKRYVVNSESLKNIGWKQKTSFNDTIKRIYKWYIDFAFKTHYWDKFI